MTDQDVQLAPATAPTAPDPADVPREAVCQHYRLQAAEHLRARGEMNALMVAILEGTRPGTVEEFVAIEHAADLCGREAGKALLCLGSAMNCEGVA